MTKNIPLVLKYQDWPQADKSAWDAMFAEGDIFDDAGPCMNWSHGSRVKRQQSYGQWLSFLARTNPGSLESAPMTRVNEEQARAYIEECEARLAPVTVKGLVSDLYTVIRAIAPDQNWSWLDLVSKRLLRKANRKGLPPAHPITAGQVFKGCFARMEKIEADNDLTPQRRAIKFREALMIAFLIARPVRRRALLGMRVGHHLVEVSDGFGLRFAAEDMKDKKARDLPLPKQLVEPIRRYLDVHRPVLLQGTVGDGLWINQYGDAITPDGFSRQLPKVTKCILGIELRPHAFRHIAATTIAEVDPEHANIIRDVLGHSTLDTSQKHYNRAKGIEACKNWQGVTENILKNAQLRS